ncbi:hypothetical protein ACX0G9_24565 [Flavitalea flava]
MNGTKFNAYKEDVVPDEELAEEVKTSLQILIFTVPLPRQLGDLVALCFIQEAPSRLRRFSFASSSALENKLELRRSCFDTLFLVRKVRCAPLCSEKAKLAAFASTQV